MARKKLSFVLTFLYCVTMVIPQHIEAAGTTTAMVADINPDPQSVGRGGSILALPDSASCMYVNPANLAQLYRSQLSLGTVALPEGISFHSLSAAFPFALGVLGASAGYLGYGNIPGVDDQGNRYAIDDSGDVQVTVGYALKLTRKTPVRKDVGGVGANLKIIHSSLAGRTADAYAIDLGAFYRLPFVEGGSVALALRNLGTGIKYVSMSEDLPQTIQGGFRYDLPDLQALSLNLDLVQCAADMSVTGGFSIAPVHPLTFRAAWMQGPAGAATNGPRIGLGMEFSDFNLNYAMAPYKDLSTAHFITIDIGLGPITKSKVAYDHYLNEYFAEARRLYNKRDFIASRRVFEDILSVYPDHQPSKEYLEKLSQELDDVEQQKIREVNRWLRKAMVAISRNDLFTARACYGEALKLDPENPTAIEGQGRIDATIESIKNEREVREQKDRIAVLWEAALGFYAKGEFVFAKEKFQEILGVDPDSAEAAKYIEEITGQLAKVNAIQINELYNKGMEYYQKNDYREAAKYFSAVVIAAPHRSDAQDYYNDCQAKIKQEESRKLAEASALKQGKVKSDVESAFNAAMKLYDRGDYEEASRAFIRARDIATRYEFDTFAERSKEYIISSRTALAEKHYKLGFDYFQKNKLESAAYEYRKALEYNPDYSSGKVELERISDMLAQQFYDQGMRAFTSGSKEKAKEFFKKSLFYKPDKVEAQRAYDRCQ